MRHIPNHQLCAHSCWVWKEGLKPGADNSTYEATLFGDRAVKVIASHGVTAADTPVSSVPQRARPTPGAAGRSRRRQGRTHLNGRVQGHGSAHHHDGHADRPRCGRTEHVGHAGLDGD